MAKVKTSVNLDDLKRELKTIEDLATNRSTTQKIANEAARIIRVRTRLGFGVAETGGKRRKLKTLSERYKEARRRGLKTVRGRRYPLSDKTTPSRSNLTFTAQMLDSIRGIVTGRGKFKVTPTGSRRDVEETNSKIAEFVAENGRPFLNLSDNELRQLEQFLLEEVKKKVK